MPIQNQDIVIYKSDTMNDTDEGGGAITGNEVVDGVSNNIFEDISTLDRTYGAVHLRKIFTAINATNKDIYFGAHAIISKLPGDEKLGVNLFNTQDWFDRRPVAQSRIENYRAKGANYTGFLYATQYQGSRVVTIFQGVGAPIPGIGEVLYLTQNSETETQYIKIVDLEHRTQEFTDASGTFTRRIIELEISQPLNYDFEGAQISRYDTITPPTTIKQTVVANAAKYYSSRPLSGDASIGDTVINVDTVYSQVIPSSLSEIAVTDADINGNAIPLIESGDEIAISINTDFTANSSFYMGSAITPGTFSYMYSGVTVTDEGGTLKSGSTTIGSINYQEGSISFLSTAPTQSGTKTITFKPAVAPVQVSDTASEAVDDANRGLVYAFTMNPPPLPGSARISYRSLGEWYDIYDDGTGKLEGLESGIGTGTINYVTGTLSVTLAALPDEGSEIIYSWGKKSRYFNRSDITPDPVKFNIQLANEAIAPGTLSITWIGSDTLAKSATADVFGVISGDAGGTINHATGLITLQPDDLPLGGTVFSIDYDHGAPQSITFNAPTKDGNGDLVLNLGQTNITPGSIEMTWNVDVDAITYQDEQEFSTQDLSGYVTLADDGQGAIKDKPGSVVDYVAGTVTFDPDTNRTVNEPVYQRVYTGVKYIKVPNGIGGSTDEKISTYANKLVSVQDKVVPAFFPQDSSGSVTVKFRTTGSDSNVSTTATISELQLDLTNGFDEFVVPGSVRFKLGTSTYIERSGQIFADVDPETNIGTLAGIFDYTTGRATITVWPDAANTASLQSLTTERGKIPVSTVTFRIPQSPVRPESLQVRATQMDGTLITATANDIGEIDTPEMTGSIDYDSGVVSIQFGSLVTAAGNESEPWYDVNAIDENGNILQPANVIAETMLYNAVSQSFLPLDSNILGLDPVRLPQDGRIPVFYQGDVVVLIHDNQTTNTFTSSTQTDLGRQRLAKVSVRDVGGNEISNTAYTVDLDNGLIDWGDLAGISQPLTITDRIEDMALLTDVQINGKLTLSQPVTHDFVAAETLVCNAIIYGDLQARTSIPFDQQTWTGVWSNLLIGSEVAAQYNNSQYPIEVLNANAIEERWALIFTNSSTVNVIGENVGQILTGVSIGAAIEPINPNTGQPYFSIPAAGWGSGWSTGNVMRFNTYGANAPVWVIQSVGQGTATDNDLSFTVEFRGDVDTP